MLLGTCRQAMRERAIRPFPPVGVWLTPSRATPLHDGPSSPRRARMHSSFGRGCHFEETRVFHTGR